MNGTSHAPTAYRRYVVALGLLQDWGFDIAAPSRLPRGFASPGVPEAGQWNLRGLPQIPGTSFVEIHEVMDTRQSYPEPSGSYSYLVHLDQGKQPGRNISFHKDPLKPTELRYHWHEYPDGARRSVPVAMRPVTLRWFLDVAWAFFAEPEMRVADALLRYPPPGPDDPR